jgi:hypothetical protein
MSVLTQASQSASNCRSETPDGSLAARVVVEGGVHDARQVPAASLAAASVSSQSVPP